MCRSACVKAEAWVCACDLQLLVRMYLFEHVKVHVSLQVSLFVNVSVRLWRWVGQTFAQYFPLCLSQLRLLCFGHTPDFKICGFVSDPSSIHNQLRLAQSFPGLSPGHYFEVGFLTIRLAWLNKSSIVLLVMRLLERMNFWTCWVVVGGRG